MVSLRRQTFCATPPHFFKIILEDTSRDIKLKVPKRFVMKYGEDLSSSVCLKLPSCSEWEVKLTRCSGKVWFEKGWPEFSRFCSLDYGNFLVFRYEGNSVFEVYIFDRTATEIDYPTIAKIEEVDEDDHLSIEISEDFPPCPKTREKPPLICPPLKKMRKSSSGKADMISENENTQPYDMVVFEKPMTNKDSHCSKSEMKGEDDFLAKKDRAGGSSSTPRFLKQTPDHEVFEKVLALQRANAFKSDENPSFKISMNRSNIHKSIMSLPSEFAKRYLIKLPAGIAILQVSSGRTWSVKFKYDHENSKAQLLNGWSAFVSDNNLKVGDVCVFILIDRFELLFEVVLPPREAPNFPMSPGHSRGAIIQVKERRSPIIKVESECNMNCEIGVSSSLEIVKNKMPKISGKVTQRPSLSLVASRVNLEAANKFASKNPFFKVTLRSYHREKSVVHIPASFSRSFIKEEKQTVILQVGDRSWRVNFLVHSKPYSASICGGWTAFSQENCLREGDVCIFELMERNDVVLMVHMFRC